LSNGLLGLGEEFGEAMASAPAHRDVLARNERRAGALLAIRRCVRLSPEVGRLTLPTQSSCLAIVSLCQPRRPMVRNKAGCE